MLTSMGPDMPFQIKGVVEAFSTERAQVSLHLAVALDVTVEHPLQAKAFATQFAAMQGGIIAGASGELRSGRELREHWDEQQRTNRNKTSRAYCGIKKKRGRGNILKMKSESIQDFPAG